MKKLWQFAVSINNELIIVDANTFDEAERLARKTLVKLRRKQADCIVRGCKVIGKREGLALPTLEEYRKG